MPDEPADAVREGLRQSGKYRHLCDNTLRRIAAWAVVRHPQPKEALKAARRKLHQVYGAYAQQTDWRALRDRVAQLSLPEHVQDPQAVCLDILRGHASSAERLSILDKVFPALFQATGIPSSVLDLACGLNPFALPWMGLPQTTHYYAVDIDHRLIEAVSGLFAALGRPGEAACDDVLSALPEREVDVVLLLKTLPCLEQQEKGAGLALLRRLRARHVVVSFPARSLGGRAKGMTEHYDQFMNGLLADLQMTARRVAYPSETFYIIAFDRA